MNMRVMNIELTRLQNIIGDMDWRADIAVIKFIAQAIEMDVIGRDQVDQVVRLVGEKYRNTIARFALICNQAADKIAGDRLHMIRGAVVGKVIGNNVITQAPNEADELWLTHCRSCGIQVRMTSKTLRTGKNDGACKC